MLFSIYGEKMTQSDNPLRRYFRQAAIHVKLPSGGKYYPPGMIDLPPNGEIPILPMTAVDEITSRTPDALFNGSAMADIIHSCVPNIKDPWIVPSIDLSTLMVAIRIASFGHEMSITSVCPKCGHTHDLTLDLRQVYDQIGTPNYDETITTGDLVFHFAPADYKTLNQNSKVQFEDQKIMQVIESAEFSEEEKLNKLGAAVRRLTEQTIHSLASSIAAVRTDDTMVTDHAQIFEFLHNCPKAVFDTVKDHIIKLREASDIKPVSVTCEECQHHYEQPFTLDMSNFFDNAS